MNNWQPIDDFMMDLINTDTYSEVNKVAVNNYTDGCYAPDYIIQQLSNDEGFLLDEVILLPACPEELNTELVLKMIDEEQCTENVQSETPDSASALALQKKDKTCLVCGDKALGYNFNAVSCESCKAFFRRNAHKTIRGRCEGQCDVTVDSRSFCKKCRLNKCFKVGMRKDMILNDEQKKQRKQKIIINKLRKHGQLPPEDTYSASPQDFAETFQDQIQNQSLEELRSTFPKLSDNDLITLMKLKSDTANASCSFNTDDDLAKKYPTWAESQEHIAEIVSKMDNMDKGIIIELRHAVEHTEFLGSTSTQLKNVPKSPTEFVNIAEGFVRRIIKVAKYIEFFKMVNKEDQIALLKGSVVEIMMLRSAVNYDIQTESWSLSTKNCINKSSAKGSESTPSPSSSGISSPVSTHSSSSSYTDGKNPATQGMDMNMINSMRQYAEKMGIDVSYMRERAASLGFDISKLSGMGAPLDLTHNSAQNSGLNPPEKSQDTRKEPEMKLSADLLKMGNPEAQNMFLTYSKFVKSLMKIIHGDLLVLKLLIMLSLFSADRPDLSQQDKIEEIQECYAKILQKYVKERFPEDPTLFAKIIMKLTDLRNINEVHTKMLLKMKLDNIEPLLIEIFDLPS